MPGNHQDDREGCSLSCARHELIGSSVVYFARRMAMLDWTFATPSMTVITSQSQRWKLDRSAIAGALFFVYLGVKAWRESRSFAEVARGRATRPVDARMGFRQGLVSNVLNPKIALFFTGLLPQFAGTRASASDLLVLGMVFNAMGIVWLAGYGILAARARNILGRPSVKRLLDRATGVVLVGLGVRLALARNPA